MNPTHVIVKLDPPVGPGDAQALAEHIVNQLAFADVESARPAFFDGFGSFVSVGEEVRS
jgi:hypothetical protein